MKVTEIFSTLKGAPLPEHVSAAMNLDSVESGRLLGNWVLADSGCDARVGVFSNAGVDLHQQMRDSIIEVIDGACENCRVVAEDIDNANLGTTFGPRVTAVLQREGDLNYLLPTLDSVVPIVKTAVGEFDVKIVSHDGLGENLDDIREGGPDSQVADAAFPPTPWVGWALMDLVSRTIIGEEPQDWSIPVRIIDATNIGESNDALPAYAEWVGFEDVFRSAWGVD
jgi:ABC-type sugar transport system substrate-binding protein